MSSLKLERIHHVTAITRDAQVNHDFYTEKLGLRLIKTTVNFDDPSAYHLYFGNYEGTPGTLITFFPYPDGYEHRLGAGMIASLTFVVPQGSLAYWSEQLSGHNPKHVSRFGESILSLTDPDGLNIELVEGESDTAPYLQGGVPEQYAIRTIRNVTLWERDLLMTSKALVEDLGMVQGPTEGQWTRFTNQSGQALVDMFTQANLERGRVAKGAIHHVAFATLDDAEEKRWLEFLSGKDYRISPQMERKYFRSLYFREPGGALFEIATDGPGFAVDEPLEQLGQSLVLPDQYEPIRAEIEKVLPPLRRQPQEVV